MGNPVVSSAFVRLLDDRLDKVKEDIFKDLPSQIDNLYTVAKSERAWHEFFEVGSLPDIPEFNGKISYLPIHPGFHTKIEHKEYAAGVQYERKLLDDKRYDVFEKRGEKLLKSAHRTREKIAIEPFAYASSASFSYMTSEEGVALVSSSHTTKSGTSTSSGFDNAGSSALSKSAVATTRILMRQFRNDISERIDMSDNFALVVPDALADTAYEIVNTPKGLDTAEGNVNPQYGRYKIIVLPRLDDYDTNNWFMVNLDLMKESLIWFNRIEPEVASTWDFDTLLLKTRVYFRCSYGWIDWRWIYGSIVS